MSVPLRRGTEVAIWIAVGIIASRTWCLDGLLVPIAIDSGSMAETLFGPHQRIVCGDCGFPFVRGWDRRARDARAVCPNCGYAGNDATQWPVLPGDRVLIDRTAFHFRLPRRWEVVAFRTPGREREWSTKRVVGLPGESVALRDGDVYINGEILRKTLDEQEAVSVPVHDASYAVHRLTGAPPRWRPDAPRSRWSCREGRFIHMAGPDPEAIDWLSYRHGRRVPGQPEQVLEGPVLTDPSFDQGRRVPADTIHPTHDLRLSFRWVSAAGPGWLHVRAVDGGTEFVVNIHPATRRAEVVRNGRPLTGSTPQGPVLGRLPVRVDISLFDRQLLVAIGGRTIVAYPYERTESDQSAGRPPFSLGGADIALEVDQVRVLRDVYYEAPAGHPSQWRLGALGSDRGGEWFVLGDNPTFSNDSRTWPGGPGLTFTALVGKPLFACGAVAEAVWKGWRFRVPNITGFRYIR